MPSLVEIDPVVPEEKFLNFQIMHGSGEEHFLILSVDFLCFVIISPWKRVGHSFEKT